MKILIKRDCTSNYNEQDPVLRLHELAAEYNDGEIIGYKLGDGQTKWSELKYITNITEIPEFCVWCQSFRDGSICRGPQIILNPFLANKIQDGKGSLEMLNEFNKYKYIKKSKSEMATDEILNNIYRKMWDNRGYQSVYYLGAINQLKVMIQGMMDDYSFTKKDLLAILASQKKCSDAPDEIKSLIDDILEEFESKEN